MKATRSATLPLYLSTMVGRINTGDSSLVESCAPKMSTSAVLGPSRYIFSIGQIISISSVRCEGSFIHVNLIRFHVNQHHYQKSNGTFPSLASSPD